MDGAKSAVSHGWLFARPVYTITLKMPQAPEGQIGRRRLFASFLVFSKMTAPGRGCPGSCATVHLTTERVLSGKPTRECVVRRYRVRFSRWLKNRSANAGHTSWCSGAAATILHRNSGGRLTCGNIRGRMQAAHARCYQSEMVE